MDDVLDTLFRAHPDDFVAVRDALAKRLRGEKRKDDAAAVARLRRPPVAVWAMNSTAAAAPALVDELTRSGAMALDAQQQVLDGAPIDVLHDAIDARRRAVGHLVATALDVLSERGTRADALAPQLRSAFETVSVDPALGAALRAGRLTALPELGATVGPFTLRGTGDGGRDNSDEPPTRRLRLVPPIQPHLSTSLPAAPDEEVLRERRAARAEEHRLATAAHQRSRTALSAAAALLDASAAALVEAELEYAAAAGVVDDMQAQIDALVLRHTELARRRDMLTVNVADLRNQRAAAAAEVVAAEQSVASSLEQLAAVAGSPASRPVGD